jgi:response regulator of citrate/malate metabolism
MKKKDDHSFFDGISTVEMDAYKGINETTKWIYCRILKRAYYDLPLVDIQDLSKLFTMSEKTTRKHLKLLVQHGFLQFSRKEYWIDPSIIEQMKISMRKVTK